MQIILNQYQKAEFTVRKLQPYILAIQVAAAVLTYMLEYTNQPTTPKDRSVRMVV
jgi:hypothetical protein